MPEITTVNQVVATCPGKIGDFFHQWPIAYHWSKKHNRKIHIGVDERMLRPLVPLIKHQPCVEDVWLLPGIEHYQIGGQPFDFGLSYQAYKQWEKIIHLGYREVPEKPLTLAVREWSGVEIPTKALKSECTLVGTRDPRPRNLLLLHGRRHDMYGEFPCFWKALWEVVDFLQEEFEEIKWVGTPSETRIAHKFPFTEVFEDRGDWIKLVDEMKDARMVMGVGGAMVALAGALKTPSIRIHDPVPGFRPEIFANFGERQWNLDTEADYGKEIRKCVSATKEVANA